MNKKFSTLVVACMASAAFSSAFAANITNASRTVTKIETEKAYQLSNADGSKILVMVPQGEGYTLKLKTATSVTDLNSTLWEIQYSYPNGSASSPDFTFVNKATGIPLQVDPKKATLFSEGTTYSTSNSSYVEMSGSVSTWKWKDFVETQGSPFGTSGLVSHFAKDSIVALVTGATPAATTNNYANSEDVYLVKAHANRSTWNGIHLRVAPAYAGGVTLSAKDLNTKLGTDPEGKSFKLSSTPELKVGTNGNSTLGNIFTDNTLRAWEPAAATNEANSEIYVEQSNFNNGTANTFTGMFLQVIDNDAKKDDPFNDVYLMADTAYINGMYLNNQNCIKFTKDSIKSAEWQGNNYLNKVKPGRNNHAALFTFEYFASQDSIAIKVFKYNTKQTVAETKDGKVTFWGGTPVTDANTVVLNKLTSISEITLGEANMSTSKPANIRFTLGEGTTNRKSINNGVYVIKNTKGQYLAVPIYNTKKATSWNAAEWVTIEADAQDVLRMPAYQWVAVQRDTLSSGLKEISRMALTNREFENVAKDIQLRKDAGATYLFTNEIAEGKDSLIIEAVPASVIANKELGYLNLEDAELAVMTYNFNYLHSYADDKFIGMMEDSVLNVKDGKYAFFMKESKEANYGFTSPYVAGLKQLTRVIYTPYVKTANGDRYITIDAEKRYRMTYDETEAQKFYLKENNFYKPASKEAAQLYYAFINVTETADSTKMGSADQDLNVILRDQVLNETRTSAFAVVPNDAPLYRRFNTELEGAVEGQEDATKILKFKEFYRGEYLMDENNKKFQDEVVNYVGIERADKATGLSFYVDTVVVKGTAGHEQKPQYFVYVDRVVVDPVPGKECQEGDNHVDANGDPTDAAHCVHATPSKAGFTVAKYMVSFADSLSAKDADKLYKFGEYTRVGFVKGLHIGDSLYILTNGFENMEASKLDTAVIRANYKATSNEFNIIDLKAEHTDAHHNYTWSFRYTNPEAAAAVDEDARRFLIESDKKDADNDIAPSKAAWLKSQNGCLVLSDAATSTFENAKTGGDNALIFNIEVGSENDLATDNEEIATSEVTVIAGAGQVTIANAAGKKVVVSNILGQTVANTVITSDNAVIAAPQGVVVVAVEGEEAVKAIVK